MKILSVANQKGGVGKSTLSLHLALAAQKQGLRVLMVDMDKQASLSLFFRAESGMFASSLFLPDAIQDQPSIIADNLAIIRADDALLSVDKASNNIITVPAESLKRFKNDYDICIIDTPPLLGVRLMSALVASNFVVTPVSIGLFELSGVTELLKTIQLVRTNFNPRIKHIGILPMKTNSRSQDERSGLEALRGRYGAAILPEVLTERAAVKKAVAAQQPVWIKVRGSGHKKAANEWLAACTSILSKI